MTADTLYKKLGGWGAVAAVVDITDEQFDLVAGHLAAALRVAAVEQPLIDEVIAAVASLRAQIVTASAVVG